MTILGIVYPKTKELLIPNKDWILVHDKDRQIAGALWQENDERHSTHRLYNYRKDDPYFYFFYGHAFSKKDNSEIKDSDLDEIVLKGPSLLTAKFWGIYLFIYFDRIAKRFVCCCDPSNQWPVYWSWSERHGLLFSDTITCLHQALTDIGERPACNRSFFTTWLRTRNVQSGMMPFDSIYEIPPGCAVFYTDERKPEMLPVWNPLLEPAQNCISQNPYDILKNYLSLHITENDRPILELSGGLESSSVLLALRAITPAMRPLFCAHYYNSKVGSSNELEHAHRVAQKTDAHLIEVENEVLAFAPLEHIPRLAKPYMRCSLLAFCQHLATRFDERGNSTIVNGHGGDALFFAPPSSSALADAILTFRWLQLRRIAMDLALIRRISLPEIVQEAIKSIFSSDLSGCTNLPSGLLAKDIAQQEPLDGRSHLHPFIQNTKVHLPGKLYQLFLAYLSLDDVRATTFPFKKATYYPFLCQPMVEFAFSIPSYCHFEGAHNRIVIRKAVSEATGYPHLWRRDKGEISGIHLLGIRQYRDHVMSYCLEGFLAKEGYIDLIKTHNAIQASCKGFNDDLMDIIYIYTAELFIQGWR